MSQFSQCHDAHFSSCFLAVISDCFGHHYGTSILPTDCQYNDLSSGQDIAEFQANLKAILSDLTISKGKFKRNTLAEWQYKWDICSMGQMVERMQLDANILLSFPTLRQIDCSLLWPLWRGWSDWHMCCRLSPPQEQAERKKEVQARIYHWISMAVQVMFGQPRPLIARTRPRRRALPTWRLGAWGLQRRSVPRTQDPGMYRWSCGKVLDIHRKHSILICKSVLDKFALIALYVVELHKHYFWAPQSGIHRPSEVACYIYHEWYLR